MHQNDVDKLFEAVKYKQLEQVKEILDSNRVDIVNALNEHETSFINHLLTDHLLNEHTIDKDAKLQILICAGALPKIDQNNDFLMPAVWYIKDIVIRNEILATVAQTHPKFNEYYPESHVQAIQGVKPEKDQALKPDGYGLYPIHYAIVAGAATGSWFEPKLYDITKIIDDGLYQGTSIVWWLLLCKRYDEFNCLTHDFSPEQRYETLKAAPQNPQLRTQVLSVAWLLLEYEKFNEFNYFTQNLTPQQSYNILKAALQNPHHIKQGLSVALLLLVKERFDDFTRLTQGLSPEQRYEISKAALQNPLNRQQGLSVALQLLSNQKFDDFTCLTHGLSSEQRYKILKAFPQNSRDIEQWLPVSWILLANKRFDDFDCFTQGFTPSQHYEILTASTGHIDPVNRVSIAWWLLFNKGFDHFIRLTQNLTPEQYFDILKSAPLNIKHDFYMQTVFVLLLNNKSFSLLLNFTKALKIEQLKQLLSHPLYKKAPNSNNVEQYSIVIKIMMELHSDFAYKLFNPCTYEDLIPWYNSIEGNNIESQFITYLCFSKLHEILHVRFANPPGTLTEEYKEDISKQLKDLFSYYQQILFQPFYYKEVADKLGMLLAQSSETIFRETVIKYLEESGNQDYLHISGLARSYALEGYAHALRIIGNTDTANARALGIIHAQAEKKANELAEENKKLKEEIAALKQRPEITKKEPSISWRTEKKPSFFAEALPVENGKNEQAEQPHDLKRERQLR